MIRKAVELLYEQAVANRASVMQDQQQESAREY
jgi:hypothetical protein